MRQLGERLGEHEDEQRHESEVDEVHRLDQTHRQKEDVEQPALRFRLARAPTDGGGTGKTVADRRADCPAAQRQAASDEGPGQLYRAGGTAAARRLGKEQCRKTHVFTSCPRSLVCWRMM